MFDSFMNIDFLMSFHHPYTFITTQKVATGSVSENGLMNGNSLLKKKLQNFYIFYRNSSISNGLLQSGCKMTQKEINSKLTYEFSKEAKGDWFFYPKMIKS